MMTTYESMRHPGTFIHANSEDIDPKTKTILYLDADGKNKSMSIATLKRWYKPVDDWDTAIAREADTAEPQAEEQPAEVAETEVFETETAEPEIIEAAEPEIIETAEETEEPKAKKKNMARKPKSLKLTELTFNGETKSIRDWAAELSLPYPTLYDRINRNGWSVEEAIRCPLGMSRKEFRANAQN